MVSARQASRTSFRRVKNFNVVIFSDTISAINVKLCVVVLVTELYPCMPLSATLMIFQSHSSVRFNRQFYVLIRLS